MKYRKLALYFQCDESIYESRASAIVRSISRQRNNDAYCREIDKKYSYDIATVNNQSALNRSEQENMTELNYLY